ncbi:hypothetical protein V1514DRAFT_336215 [Lipomyces japonicus]|uniref:uncharacterized protein n=1 Tax=Lipomyces japonicus TaxID=56871 RepID=UPI0034CE1918
MSSSNPTYSLAETSRSLSQKTIVSPGRTISKLSSVSTSVLPSHSNHSLSLSRDLGVSEASEADTSDNQGHGYERPGHRQKDHRLKLKTENKKLNRRTIKVFDGYKDGYNLGLWKKCMESLLIVMALVLAIQHSWQAVVQNSQFVLVCASILATVLFLKKSYWSMPSVLYIYLFPTILTLVDYPQYLRLNLLSSLCSLPLRPEILSNLIMAISPSTPEIYYIHANVTEIVNSLTTTSLSSAECSLAGTLLVNLLLNAKSMEMIFLRIFIFGSYFSLLPATPLIAKIMKLSRLPRHRRPANSAKLKLIYASSIYSIFLFNVLIFVRWHLHGLLGQDPFFFIFNYLFVEDGSKSRLKMLAYWITWLIIGITFIEKSAKNWTIDIRRKVWHGMVVGMFLVCGTGSDAHFTSLSLSIALTLFFLSEVLRATTIPPLGSKIHMALIKYTDERDSCGPIIVSHLFLLLGIALPIFWSSSPVGIICLGFGDACASIIGRRFGKHKWFDSPKSIEGTMAFTLAAFFGLMIAKHVIPGYLPILGEDLSDWWCLFTAASTAILEATSGMNDNVIVPVYMYIFLRFGTSK